MKFFKFLFGLIGAILLLAIITVVVIGIMIYDKTDNSNKEITDQQFDTTELLYAYIENSLEETDSNAKVELLLNEYKVNCLLQSIVQKINIPVVEIKSMYSIYNEDGSVSFEAPIKALFFNSCVKGKLDIKVSDDGTLSVILSSIGLGKLGTDSKLVKALVFGFVNTKKIEKQLSEKGTDVNIEKNSDNITISVTKENLSKIIENSVKDETQYLIKALIDEFLGNNKVFDFKFNDEDVIGAILYLETLKHDGTLTNDLEKTTVTLEDVKNKSITLIENDVMNYKNSSIVFDYLVRGYEKLNDKQKAVIDPLDFSSIGITSNSMYPGIIERSSLTMAKIFLEAFSINPLEYANYILGGYFDMSIRDTSLSELFNSFGFIGTSMAFIDEEKIAYFTIESLYTEITDNTMDVYMVINVNGYEINAHITATEKTSNGALLTLKINTIKLGSEELSESVKNNILKFLEGTIAKENIDYLKVDAQEETISLDFSNYLDGEEFYQYLISQGLNKISFVLSNDNNGELIIRFSK